MTARYKSACCCKEEIGFGPCFMGWGSVPKSVYSPPEKIGKKLPMPVSTGYSAFEGEEVDPIEEGILVTNPFDNWEYCGDKLSDELVFHCPRNEVIVSGEASPAQQADGEIRCETCDDPGDDFCCGCGPYEISTKTTGDRDGVHRPALARYRTPWSTSKMFELPYGFYSGGEGLPDRVDNTLYHWTYEPAKPRVTAFSRSGYLYPMDGLDSMMVPGDYNFTGQDLWDLKEYKGLGGDGDPCYQQEFLGPYGHDTLCAQFNSFSFCNEEFRSQEFGYPLTKGQANMIGATVDVNNIPSWSTSKWGWVKSSDHLREDGAIRRPREEGGNNFWLKEISNFREDEWYYDFNIFIDSATNVGLVPGQGPEGTTRLTDTLLGVIRRERWWKKYYNSIVARDNQTNPSSNVNLHLQGDDASEYSGDFSPEETWFGYENDAQSAASTYDNKAPEYVYKGCSGCPIFSWEIVGDDRLMGRAPEENNIKLNTIFTGPLGTLPVMEPADIANIQSAIDSMAACECLSSPFNGSEDLDEIHLGLYLLWIFSGYPVWCRCSGGGACTSPAGFITPGIANVLIAFGIIPDPVPTDENNDYRIFKKKLLIYDGDAETERDGICCFRGVETSGDCTEEHDYGGCGIEPCGGLEGVVPLANANCAFSSGVTYESIIPPDATFWEDWPTTLNDIGEKLNNVDILQFSENNVDNPQIIRDFLFSIIENPQAGDPVEGQPPGRHYFIGTGWQDDCVQIASERDECSVNFVGCADLIGISACRYYGGQFTKYETDNNDNPIVIRCFDDDLNPDGIIDYCLPCAKRNKSDGGVVPGPPANINVKGTCSKCLDLPPTPSPFQESPDAASGSIWAWDIIRLDFPELELETWRSNDNPPVNNSCDCFEINSGVAWGAPFSNPDYPNGTNDETYNPELDCDPCPNGYIWTPNANCINTNGRDVAAESCSESFSCSMNRGPVIETQNFVWDQLSIKTSERWFYGKPGGWGFASEAGPILCGDDTILATGSQHKQQFPQIATRSTIYFNDISSYAAPWPQEQECSSRNCEWAGTFCENVCPPCPNCGNDGTECCPDVCSASVDEWEDIGCGIPVISICAAYDVNEPEIHKCDSIGLSTTCDGVWIQYNNYELNVDCVPPWEDPTAANFRCGNVNNTSFIITDPWLVFDETKGPEADIDEQVNIFGVRGELADAQVSVDENKFFVNNPDDDFSEPVLLSDSDYTIMRRGSKYTFDQKLNSNTNKQLKFKDQFDNILTEEQGIEYEGSETNPIKTIITPNANTPDTIIAFSADGQVVETDIEVANNYLIGWLPTTQYNNDAITPIHSDRDWYSPPYGLMDVQPSAGANPACCWDSAVTRRFSINWITGEAVQSLCPIGEGENVYTRPDGTEVRDPFGEGCLNPLSQKTEEFCNEADCGFTVRKSFGEITDPVCGQCPSVEDPEYIYFCCHFTGQCFGYNKNIFEEPSDDDPNKGTGITSFPCNECPEDCPEGQVCCTVLNPDAIPPEPTYTQQCVNPNECVKDIRID